ncbi:MAG: radical SAM protein [Pseudonocardiaceae bacterium]
MLVRLESPFGYGRASYELNLGCNYDCEHCYLGLKRFDGLSWPDRERLLHMMRDAGVLWLQLTGGEPMIDRLFTQVYSLAHELGMMLTILSNGSRLSNSRILDLLTARRPYRITLSVYGASAESYDGLTQRKGAFRMFEKGLYAGHEAGLPLVLSMIVTKRNAHEVDKMRAIAERLELPFAEYVNMVPTIYGGAETLPSQSVEHLRKRKVFTGCNAGHTFFHVDPHGNASICKVGRDPHISLIDEGVEGLCRLGGVADGLLLRQGGLRRLHPQWHVRHMHAPGAALPQGQGSFGYLLPAPRKEGGCLMTTDVEIGPRPVEPDEIEFVADLDVLSESDVCSCSAGDDNPF